MGRPLGDLRRFSMRVGVLAFGFVIAAIVSSGSLASGQSTAGTRHVTTLDALREFPLYYHLQNVILRGELVESGTRLMLRSGDQEMRVVLRDTASRSGPVEVRGQMIDVGRLEQGDPRVPVDTDARERGRWPRPGEELVVIATDIREADPDPVASVRALALEPWKFEGQTVTVVGNFGGRNLFGELPDAPSGNGRYGFTLRSAQAAIWVTSMRPRGPGFDLDVDRRMGTDRWLRVTGTVARARGLVTISATRIVEAQAERAASANDVAVAPVPMPPGEVVFSSPTGDEVGVAANTVVRIQFSRGLDEASIAGHVTARYVGASGSNGTTGTPPPTFAVAYDAASRSLAITFATPLEPFRTVEIATTEGLLTFDKAPVTPWKVTFSVGG